MDPTSDHEATGRRNRSIRLAVVMSLLSKLGTFGLQLLAIPVAVRVLGRQEFGLYTSVSLTLTTIMMFEIGVGPALAHGIAAAQAQGDRERLRVLASSAFWMVAGIALMLGMVLAAVLWWVPIEVTFGEGYRGKEAVLRPALWLGLGLFLLLLVLNLTERMREGFLEVGTTNAFGAAGNVLAALVLAVGIHWVPQVWFMVLAVTGVQVLMKLINTASLWVRRPDVVPRPGRFDGKVSRSLLGDGLAFSTCCLLSGWVETSVCGKFVAGQGGPSAVALYGVFVVSVSVMLTGMVMMISTPTWPAVAEALARGDLEWARKAARKLRWFGCGFAICAVLGLVTLGPWVFGWWLGRDFQHLDRGLFAAFGVYFLAHIWRHLNHTLMIGTGQVKQLVLVQLSETALLAVVAWFALKYGGMEWMLAAMGGVIFLMTGRVLPPKVQRVLNPQG